MKTQAVARPPLTPTLLWLGLAITAGATGVFTRIPSPGPQLLILALAAATIVAGTRAGAFRSWIDGADPRLLVAAHVVRLAAGVVFLILAAQGELSPLFARNAGWGDIVAGLLAIPLMLTGLPRTPGHRAAWLAWNIVGSLDFVIVLGTATYVALTAPGSLALLFQLPLILIPVFAVPLLIASHVFLFRRLAALRLDA